MSSIIGQYFDTIEQQAPKEAKRKPRNGLLHLKKAITMDVSMISEGESSDEADGKTPQMKKAHSVERKHESELHRQLGIPLKTVQKTSKIVKMQMQINELAIKEE